MCELWFRLRCWWHGLNPEFVRRCLEVDAMTSEAGFDDVVKMLKWLDEK